MHLLQDAALEKSGNGREARSGHPPEITKADYEACGQTWCEMSGNQMNRELDQYLGIKAGSKKFSYYCQGKPQYFHHPVPLCSFNISISTLQWSLLFWLPSTLNGSSF